MKTWITQTITLRTFSTDNVLKQLVKPESSTAKWVYSNWALEKLRHREVTWLVHSTATAALGLQLRRPTPSSVPSSANCTANWTITPCPELAANKYSCKQRAQNVSLSSCFSGSCKQTSASTWKSFKTYFIELHTMRCPSLEIKERLPYKYWCYKEILVNQKKYCEIHLNDESLLPRFP